MAFQIFWKIPFVSLRSGTLYTVNIYKDGTLPSGYPLTLKGGASPFSTQEDDSDDIFTPIRTQSGYLRIVDDGLAENSAATPQSVAFNWKDMLPATDTDRPVTLTHQESGQTVVDWQGFMQAQNFGSTLYGNPQERELPIQCLLSSLSASYMDGSNRALRNFAYIIKQAFGNVLSDAISINGYYFQGGETAQTFLLKLVDWQNFIDEDGDSVHTKYDNLQALTDVCAFWGWSCRVCGNSVYFCCSDDNTLMPTVLELTQAQLNTMAGGTSDGSTSGPFLSSLSLNGDVFASMDNDELNIRGYNKATVHADCNASDGVVMEAFPSSVEDTMSNNGTYNENYGSAQHTNMYGVFSTDITEFETLLLKGTCESGNASFNKMLIKESIQDSGSQYNVVRIRKTFVSASQTAFASFETMFHHSFYDTSSANGGFTYGGISIKGDVYRKGLRYEDYGNNGVGNHHIYIRVGIGVDRANALWYNGTTWSSNLSAISVLIGGQTPSKQLLWINTNHDNLQGKLFVDFLGSSDIPIINNERRFEIVNFSVSFQRATYSHLIDQRVRSDSKSYSANNTNIVRDEWDADCIYASDNELKWGWGVVMNPDGKWMTTLTYGTQAKHPEQHMADRVAAYSSTSKRKITSELRSEQIGTVTPRNSATLDGTTGHVIAISHEWRDDVTQLTILEL